MKKILLTFISAFTFCGAYSQWINQNLPPITYDSYMYDVEVVDANNVWAAQQDGSTGATTQYTKNFVRTTDGGNTWTHGSVAGSPAANVICNIWPTSATDCYVSMFGASPALGGIWKTTDGGTTWSEVGTNMFTAATSFPNVVYFWDAQNGMALGDPVGNPLKYEIYLTNDAGATWVAVPAANIPALTDPAEYGITNLFSNAGGYVWFGTTYGDVYRSIDGGNNWTKSATGFPPYTPAPPQRQDISDIAFSDQLHGIATQFDGTATLLKQTSDGGLTWVDVIPSGLVYASDIDAIPGTTTGVFVSAGSSAAGFGTTFSTDNGLTWTDLDISISHTALDFLDASTGWSGEFVLANSSAGGAWKFTGVPIPVACGSPNVSPGTTYINPHVICWLDNLVVNTSGVVAPTDGVVHGFSLVVSNADISGNNDLGTLISTGVIIGGTGVIVGSTIPTTTLLNDASIFPTGIYYFTPVVYGNATGSGNVTQLTFDINCTNTGTSVMVNLLANGDPLCATSGIEQNTASSFGIKNIYPVPAKENVNVVLNAKENGMVTVSVKDLVGREVFSNQFSTIKGENNLVLDLSKQTAGVYVLTVTGNESTAVSKFVKD